MIIEKRYGERPMGPESPMGRDPWCKPTRGLSKEDFLQVGKNGFGDGENSFPHSMAWFKGALYVGTTRSNMAMLKFAIEDKIDDFEVWPVETPDSREELNKLDRRAQIWRLQAGSRKWQRVYTSPMVSRIDNTTGPITALGAGQEQSLVAREVGYRGMTIFKGRNDKEAALYISTFVPRASPGVVIMRTYDGVEFEKVSEYGVIGQQINSIRSMVAFNGKLYICPTGSRGTGNMNISEATVYESGDPGSGHWERVSEQGFGTMNNESIFSLCTTEEYLYAGTFNNDGFEVWRSKCKGERPYKWEKVISGGAGRGAENQIALSMVQFKGYLYIGTAIQNGGHDRINNIGPAASQLVRFEEDSGRVELVVGEYKSGERIVNGISGLSNGFGNICNGYFWRMCEHDGWLYVGTFDRSSVAEWIKLREENKMHGIVKKVGIEHIRRRSGSEIWRSYDGENWVKVTTNGFGNAYNFGVRTLASTPHGLYVGFANPFGPRIAKKSGQEWVYEHNPRGGLEIWLGENKNNRALTNGR